MWGNGMRLRVAGEMLTLLTEEGASQRQKWLARGDSTDSGDETSDLGESPTRVASRKAWAKKRAKKLQSTAPPVVVRQRPAGWRGFYEDQKSRVRRYFGWSK